eukprot:412129_1
MENTAKPIGLEVIENIQQLSNDSIHKTPVVMKLITTIFACISIASVYFLKQEVTTYHVIGLLFSIIVYHSYALLLYLLFKAQYLHRVVIHSKYEEGMGKIVYPYKIMSHADQCILSFGEFISNRGSSIFNLFILTAVVMMTFCFSVFAMKWTEMNKQKNDDNYYYEHTTMILFLFGGIGYGIIAIWEAHYSSTFHKIMHYIGSVAIVLSPLALCLKDSFTFISVLLLSLEWFFFIIWFIVISKTSITFDDKHKVHKKTLFILMIEMLAIFFQLTSMCIFIFTL